MKLRPGEVDLVDALQAQFDLPNRSAAIRCALVLAAHHEGLPGFDLVTLSQGEG